MIHLGYTKNIVITELQTNLHAIQESTHIVEVQMTIPHSWIIKLEFSYQISHNGWWETLKPRIEQQAKTRSKGVCLDAKPKSRIITKEYKESLRTSAMASSIQQHNFHSSNFYPSTIGVHNIPYHQDPTQFTRMPLTIRTILNH